MDIGEKLSAARQSAGLTQEQAAEHLNVSRQTISNWENDKTYPDILMSMELSKLYGVDVTSLLEDKAGSSDDTGETLKRYDYAKCAKHYRYMLLLVIPSIIVGLLTNGRIIGVSPAVKTVGIILSIIISLVKAYFTYALSTEDERYKKAAVLFVCSAVISVVINLIPAENLALRSVLSLTGLAVGVFYGINFYSANADVLSQPAPALSDRWHLIKKFFMILTALTCASMMLIFVPFLLILVVIAVLIMTIVHYVMELTALIRSSKACSLYAEALGRPEE